MTLITALLVPQPLAAQPTQTDRLFQWELQTIYLTNLERRKAGLPPMRWNRELTEAARWFAKDAVEAHAAGFCDHTDSLQRGPGQRIRDYGFTNLSSWAENAVCGYTGPESAVRAWMNSPAHKTNILNPGLREIGLGYYVSDSGRGYIVQDMTKDIQYAPVIINNEAISTTTPAVTLYIYDQSTGGDFAGVGPTQAVMIANTPGFEGAVWEPYAVEKSWSLAPGDGWKTVYAKTRDRQGRTTSIQDTIYLGSVVPAGQLTLSHASGVASGFKLEALDATGYSELGLGLNWLADDSDAAFEKIFGNGEQVDDADAIGGSAYRMFGADRNTFVALYSARYFRALPSVAYFRLKIDDNSGQTETLRLVVNDGIDDVATRSLKGVDFTKAGAYQEFAVPFTLPQEGGGLLAMQVYRAGAVEATLDAVAVSTAPAAWSLPLEWSTPDNYYRSSGIQARFSNPNGAFAALVELNSNQSPVAITPTEPQLVLTPETIVLETDAPETAPAPVIISVECENCSEASWQAASDVDWLMLTIDGNRLTLAADSADLAPGVYYAAILVTVTSPEGMAPQTIQVSLVVGDKATLMSHRVFMPMASR